ncbi:hypothetical protein CC2G_000220 [Coprinopsis cinerea AmutBmut pab1-1]|nr:hypothetical protein CC2G_000220 [Coprinopsis cinerea AmutBmut pab1-1]
MQTSVNNPFRYYWDRLAPELQDEILKGMTLFQLHAAFNDLRSRMRPIVHRIVRHRVAKCLSVFGLALEETLREMEVRNSIIGDEQALKIFIPNIDARELLAFYTPRAHGKQFLRFLLRKGFLLEHVVHVEETPVTPGIIPDEADNTESTDNSEYDWNAEGIVDTSWYSKVHWRTNEFKPEDFEPTYSNGASERRTHHREADISPRGRQ